MTESSHPPALLRRTARTLREETPVARGDRVVVAVSGGGDSIALLHVMARLAGELGIELCAHGVDHGLRAAAAAELDLAERLAASLGIGFTRTVLGLADGGNLQARAREARYAALDAVRQREDARWVATAHHADDRAETVLMRILRGTSPRGLAVLPAASPHRLRPFIRSPARAIQRHLLRHGLAHANDPSNRDPRFLRTRIRYELIPLLESLAPGASSRLNLLADEWAEPVPVVVTDAQGHELPVRRSQVAQIRRAQKLKHTSARIWLAGGREIIPWGDSSGVEIGVEIRVEDGIDVGAGAAVPREAPAPAGVRVATGHAARRPARIGSPAPASKKPLRGQQNPAGRGAKPTKSD
jgi:tRNA(Ile)-lysidine synthase